MDDSPRAKDPNADQKAVHEAIDSTNGSGDGPETEAEDSPQGPNAKTKVRCDTEEKASDSGEDGDIGGEESPSDDDDDQPGLEAAGFQAAVPVSEHDSAPTQHLTAEAPVILEQKAAVSGDATEGKEKEKESPGGATSSNKPEAKHRANGQAMR